jgi:hypothetical protein
MDDVASLAFFNDVDPANLVACLTKLDRAKPEQASALVVRSMESFVHTNGRGANVKVFKLFVQLCAIEATLHKVNATSNAGQRSSSGRGLFNAFARKSLLDEYRELRSALRATINEIGTPMLGRASVALGGRAATLPMLAAAASLASTRIEVAGLYAKLGGAFGGGVPPAPEAVGDIEAGVVTAAQLLEPHKQLLPRIAEDIASELGLLRRLLRLRGTLGRCEVLESTLLAHESQQILIGWRRRAIRRARQDVPPLERDAQGDYVELYQVCMNSLPTPPVPQLTRDQSFGPRCDKVREQQPLPPPPLLQLLLGHIPSSSLFW